MKKPMLRSFLLVLSVLLGTAFPADAQNTIPLVQDGKSDYVIVIAKDAPPPTARGAAELQSLIAQISGATLPILHDDAPLPAHALLIGPSKFTDALDAAALGSEGFIIRTKGANLIIAGHGPRATMYGCSAFLETVGVRWLTPKVTLVPKQTTITIPALNITQLPAFEYREPYFTEALDRDWAARNRLNGNFANLDASTGGRVAYSDFVHTFDLLIPTSFFDKHPEYFPLINGKRTSGYVQRCLTNPDVLALAIEGVKKSFADHPEAAICSVSQNDCASWCTCDKCKALTEQYGAHSGLYLWFVNQVAQAIEKTHPDKIIDTLAYQFTEAPPKGITPRKNVRIRLCPISVCESHPYEHDDAPASRAYVANLAAWSAITDSLYIWHYNTDFAHYLMPFPDFNQFPESIRLYKRSGVKGIFFEGDYAPGGGGSDAELRSYVMAKLLWDPTLDTDSLITEWMRGVYGEDSARSMRRWFDLLQARAALPQRHLGIYDPPTPALFTPEVITEGDGLFADARKFAHTPLQVEYVEKARLGLRYVKLVQHPTLDASLDEFLASARKLGITQTSEGGSLDAWEKTYRAQPALNKPGK